MITKKGGSGMRKLTTLISTLFIAGAVLSACGENEEATSLSNNEKEEEIESIETVEIITTLFPLEYFAARIGGEHVEVENMVPAGSDAHSFEPTANQMIEVAEADLFIYNGADFEGFAESISEAVDSHDVTILTASEGINLIGYDHSDNVDDDHDDHGHENNDHDHDENNHGNENNDHDHEENDHGHENNDHDHDGNNHGNENNDHGHENNNNEDDHDNGHDHDHGDEDPHVWLDPIRSIKLAENIKKALINIRPDAEEEFTANFEELKADLEKLDDSFQRMADEITKDTIIVSHAGYGYWEDRYGIHQKAISGLSSTNEPSIKQIEEVISFMESNNYNYVMFEQNIPSNVAETVREQVGAEELWLHNLESLTEENIANEDDYFSLMEQNIETLRKALQ